MIYVVLNFFVQNLGSKWYLDYYHYSKSVMCLTCFSVAVIQ